MARGSVKFEFVGLDLERNAGGPDSAKVRFSLTSSLIETELAVTTQCMETFEATIERARAEVERFAKSLAAEVAKPLYPA